MILKSWLILVLSFPLASTSASLGDLPGGATQVLIPEESEPLMIMLLPGYGCCTCPFTVTMDHGSTKGPQRVMWCKTFLLTTVTEQQPYLLRMMRTNHSFLCLLAFWYEMRNPKWWGNSHSLSLVEHLLCTLVEASPFWDPGSLDGQTEVANRKHRFSGWVRERDEEQGCSFLHPLILRPVSSVYWGHSTI